MERRILSGTATGAAGATGTAGSQILTGAGVPSDASGANGDFYIRTNGMVYVKAAGAWGSPLVSLVAATSSVTFDQTANTTTAVATAADVNVGALTLLTDAITAIGVLQTAINLDRHLINSLIDIAQAKGIAG